MACEGLRPVGFAAVLPLRGVLADLLEYLAVDSSVRSGGVGSRLFTHLVSALPPGRSLVLEVEPASHPDPALHALQERRLALYARLGAVVLPVPHRVPDLSDPSAPGLDLHLLWAGPFPSGDVLAGLSGVVLAEAYG